MEKNYWGGHIIKNVNIFPSEVQYTVPNIRWSRKATYDFDRICYVHEGEFILLIDNIPYIVRKHQLALLPANKTHAYATNTSSKLALFSVDLRAEANDTNLFEFLGLADDNHVVTVKDHEKLEQYFEQAMRNDEFSVIDSYHLNRTAEIIKILAVYVENRLFSRPTDDFFDPVLSYMESHLDENVSLEALADIVYLHPSYFVSKFKQVFGISPMKYYNDLRIRSAVRLLVNSELSLKEIAYKIGINNQYYFSYFFKEHCGIPPMEYRKMFRVMKDLPEINQPIR